MNTRPKSLEELCFELTNTRPKTLEEIDSEFCSDCEPREKPARPDLGAMLEDLSAPQPNTSEIAAAKGAKGKKMLRCAGDIIFWLALASVLLAGLIYSAGGNGSRGVFNYSIMNVLSGSMQSEIPQGSMVLVKRVEPNTLQVGDDITFLHDKDAIWTHRIAAIYEDYEDSGTRGFQTQGVENPEPDAEIVAAENILGKVVYHTRGLGGTIDWLGGHWLMILLLPGGLIGAAVMMKIVFAKEQPENEQQVKMTRRKHEKA
jgi:signal peptidase I